MSDPKYWLGFSLIPNIGPVRLKQILDSFSSLEKAWFAPSSAYREIGFTQKATNHLQQYRNRIDLNTEWEKVGHVGASILTLADSAYPEALKNLTDAPPVLYYKGTLRETDHNAIAIVGTRNATRYGKDGAYTFSWQLANHGITIISGLALGIDTAAHEGALAGGGRTIGILGCGIDQIYPRQNARLARKIIDNGALISEFPIGTPPRAANFPPRNRIISGFSMGVLVAEAPEHSGALITVETALEQGREVFAIPANIFNPMGKGTNRLIQDGARLVTNAHDILNELNLNVQQVETRQVMQQIEPDTPEEARLLEYLSADPIHIDDLCRLTHLPIESVSSTLTMMELKGLAQMVGQMQYCLTTYP